MNTLFSLVTDTNYYEYSYKLCILCIYQTPLISSNFNRCFSLGQKVQNIWEKIAGKYETIVWKLPFGTPPPPPHFSLKKIINIISLPLWVRSGESRGWTWCSWSHGWFVILKHIYYIKARVRVELDALYPTVGPSRIKKCILSGRIRYRGGGRDRPPRPLRMQVFFPCSHSTYTLNKRKRKQLN